NKIITVWKFRTMCEDACALPTRQVQARDPRLTRIGGFLRYMSLDELPQLFNVIAGDMALVGPRPHAIDMRASDKHLAEIAPDYTHRHRVKPGITGWAQVNGSRGPIETPEQVKERMRLDLEYISKASCWFDAWIIARTIPALAFGRNTVR
ncbi:MAG: sugar transferase, partial [Caulobacterales bacterium]